MEHSEATRIAYRLVEEFGETAHRMIDALFDQLSIVDGAALEHDWSFWARPKQVPPPGDWQSWGFLTGRGTGKTVAISKFLNEIVEREGPIQVLLVAQDEASTEDIQVNGLSGLIATAPPWNRPTYSTSEKVLYWPNGAAALIRTPEAPGKIRGPEFHLAWLSELQSWPQGLREEAFSNALLATRLGKAQVVWDSTPKKRHPLLKGLLEEAKTDPEKHVVVRGSTHENAINLANGYIEKLERKYGGTAKGREELGGEVLDDVEGALVKDIWINRSRRPLPDVFLRHAVSIDPATTARKGSDTSGIIEGGTGPDGQLYILANKSGKHPPSAWANIALDLYIEGKCDVMIAETNKGGELIAQNIRTAAKERDWRIVVIGKDEKTKHVNGIVYLKEVYAKGAKEDRAQPAAVAYEAGFISHVIGADLGSLEDTLTTWEPTPGAESPGDLDALAHLANDLLDVATNKPDPKAGFPGLDILARKVAAPPASFSINRQISAALGGTKNRL